MSRECESNAHKKVMSVCLDIERGCFPGYIFLVEINQVKVKFPRVNLDLWDIKLL